MVDKTIQIEVNGLTLEAQAGQMLIEVTDAHGIYIPRFCYHKKLSIAANCRMCLVDIEKAPKPLPACATPVIEGMKVSTQSQVAMDAQKSVMEFLLINHPLDCPICDQGGECELQDLAMGYGRDVSRYHETKRVVKDKNIGPLVQTDMTRCIHCTRCIRLGEEIAGMRELGATGRGEHMQIGTYIEKAMHSELSGNVIDVCPVGALTSKPFRYSARSWELQQKPGIAAHDCVGSHLYYHVKDQRIKRVVPRENDAINENWLSDRDRFSYEGLYHKERLLEPMLKRGGSWKTVSWSEAIDFCKVQLLAIKEQYGAEQIAGLITSAATLEEAYLFQKLIRSLGSPHVDHRLYQSDFRLQQDMPLFPWLGQTLQDLESQHCIFYLLGHLRQLQPLLNHRVRKAVLQGADVYILDTQAHEYNYRLAETRIVAADQISRELKSICLALYQEQKMTLSDVQLELLDDAQTPVDAYHRQLAKQLIETEQTTIMIGSSAEQHPDYALILYLCTLLGDASQSVVSVLSSGPNTAGLYLAGAVPHRGPHGDQTSPWGKEANQIMTTPFAARILLGVEVDRSINRQMEFISALKNTELVIVLSAYLTDDMLDTATVLLPIALAPETEGTFINIEGVSQSFEAAIHPPHNCKKAWQLLQEMAHALELDGFAESDCAAIRKQLLPDRVRLRPMRTLSKDIQCLLEPSEKNDTAYFEQHAYQVDAQVKRASALQQVYQASLNHAHSVIKQHD